MIDISHHSCRNSISGTLPIATYGLLVVHTILGKLPGLNPNYLQSMDSSKYNTIIYNYILLQYLQTLFNIFKISAAGCPCQREQGQVPAIIRQVKWQSWVFFLSHLCHFSCHERWHKWLNNLACWWQVTSSSRYSVILCSRFPTICVNASGLRWLICWW